MNSYFLFHSTEGWKAFFEAAGIPSEHAIRYATVFVENRVQTSMLEDLNKDYLKDMQITATGDVIAILKHAHKNVSISGPESDLFLFTIVTCFVK